VNRRIRSSRQTVRTVWHPNRVRINQAAVDQKLPVLVGDANGADRSVEQYLDDQRYRDVQVFCMKGRCRNNVGYWPSIEVSAPSGLKGAEFYTLKDKEMTSRASIGLMLWDGESAGTLANISRLIRISR
jgi:hypothetical protein